MTREIENATGPESDAATKRVATPVIAFGLVALILVVVMPLMIFLNRGRGSRDTRLSYSRERQNENGDARAQGPPPTGEPGVNARIDTLSKDAAIEQVEKVAAQFMRRISSDDRPYVFPPYAVNALGDIRRRVEQLSRSPALAAALNSMTTAAPSIAAESRREGIEPGLVIFAALAEAEGGRAAGDPVTAARRILPDLLSLRKTLGTESAEKSLILVAAYKMGGGTKKSHPLLRTMTRVVKNPLTDRNVWYLREHASLDDTAYDFVVNFLALGVIAENPRRFGVAATAIAY
ncbi:MAG TPA: hypothetical protein VJZ26_10805 [Blastocatellia bacterium]|nr:hypothetical protein [Blastocatellia bacterium]